MPALPLPMAGAMDVTILCDDFDGIVVLPDYNKFRRVFEAASPESATPEWRDLVWTYIKDPDIPIVAFERVAEEFPLQVEAVLRELLDDKTFSLEHLYAVVLHYKQPVEGLDDLDDDRQLWDLFNGNAPEKPQTKRTAARTKKKPSRKIPASKKTKPPVAARLAKKTRVAVAKSRTTATAKRAVRPASKAKGKASVKRSSSRKSVARPTPRTKRSQTKKR
jgi:hypothetical protein